MIAHNRIKRSLLKAACMMTAVLLCLTTQVSCATGSTRGSSGSEANANASDLFIDEVFCEELPLATGGDPSLSVSAESAILIEASTGRVLWSKNADLRTSMASTTKIMTAFVAIENADVSKTVSVSPAAVGIEGSSIYLYEGERLRLEDLLYAMLLESANDAAAAIAIEVGGSIEGFADMMNEKAVELGLENTHFMNPHGLDDPQHYTTAGELAVIAAEAMRNETFKTIVSTYKRTIPLNETEGVRLLINHNKMLSRYDGAVGIKTGYTKKSGRCLVSAAERDHVELICVTLNAPNDWSDHEAMLDYGFSLYESRLLCDEGQIRYNHPVVGGADACVTLTNESEVRVTVPKNAPTIRQTVELFPFSYAPIREGETVGRVLFTLDGKVLAQVSLKAAYSVDRVAYKKTVWEKFRSLLG